MPSVALDALGNLSHCLQLLIIQLFVWHLTDFLVRKYSWRIVATPFSTNVSAETCSYTGTKSIPLNEILFRTNQNLSGIPTGINVADPVDWNCFKQINWQGLRKCTLPNFSWRNLLQFLGWNFIVNAIHLVQLPGWIYETNIEIKEQLSK